MRAAIRIGIKLHEYDEMTPHELNMHIEEFNQSRIASQEEKITLAYLGAYWQRVKRMPSLKKVLGKESTEKRQQTAADMLEEIKKINAAMGGTTY